MKNILSVLAVAFLAAFSASAFSDPLQQGVLATATGHFVLGSVETGSAATLIKDLYLLDTKTGQVWLHGCIANGQDGKCSRFGLRPLKVSDGAGGEIFDSVKDSVETKAAFDAVKNTWPALGGKQNTPKK
jgi:hypothetical protein